MTPSKRFVVAAGRLGISSRDAKATYAGLRSTVTLVAAGKTTARRARRLAKELSS